MNAVFITGASSGLGLALAREFSIRGYALALHGRSAGPLTRARAAVAGLGAASVSTFQADLAEPAQVRQLCDDVLERTSALSIVINNAAAGGGRDPKLRETNSAGTELRMAVNVLAPQLIARQLGPALPADGRIVQVGSLGQEALDVNDMNFTRGYDGVSAYCRSKLALIMDAIDFAATGAWVNVVHPAHLMPTTMVRDSGFTPASSVDDGVLPVLRAALDTGLADVRGQYFHRFEVRPPHPQAADTKVRAHLAEWLHSQL